MRLSQDQRQTGLICAEEYATAKLRDTKLSVYSKEIDILRQPKAPRLMFARQLCLFIDSKGFLRCGGRLHNAPLSDLTKFPYLLPANTLSLDLSSGIYTDVSTILEPMPHSQP